MVLDHAQKPQSIANMRFLTSQLRLALLGSGRLNQKPNASRYYGTPSSTTWLGFWCSFWGRQTAQGAGLNPK